MNSTKKIIAWLITYHRKQKKISCQELADRLQKDRQYIWKIESANKGVSDIILDQIIEALNCSHTDFFNPVFLTAQTSNLNSSNRNL